jgi:hypothetical protein
MTTLMPAIIIAFLLSTAVAGCAHSTAQIASSPVYVSKLVGFHNGVCGVAAREAFDRLLTRLQAMNLTPCQCILTPLSGLELDWAVQPGNAVIATLRKPVKLHFRAQDALEQLGVDPLVSIALYNRYGTNASSLYLGYRPKRWHGARPWPVVYATFQLNEAPLHIARRECGS